MISIKTDSGLTCNLSHSIYNFVTFFTFFKSFLGYDMIFYFESVIVILKMLINIGSNTITILYLGLHVCRKLILSRKHSKYISIQYTSWSCLQYKLVKNCWHQWWKDGLAVIVLSSYYNAHVDTIGLAGVSLSLYTHS